MSARQIKAVLIFIYGVALATILYNLYLDFDSGGNKWRQGDWLINNDLTFVRRGFFGSALIQFSDVLGFDPLVVLVAFQAIIILTIFSVTLFVVTKNDVSDKLLLVLISPIFLLFWFNDYRGAIRKEILAYFSFMPLFIAAYFQYRSLTLLLGSSFIFIIATFAHEANVLFFPFFALAVYFIYGQHTQVSQRAWAAPFIICLVLVLFISLVAGIYAITFPRVEDYAEICDPLIWRGLSDEVCKGAIRALERDLSHELKRTSDLFFSNNGLLFFLAYALALYPFWVLVRETEKPIFYLIILIISGFAFLPLYIVAVDWGRWMNFHISSVLLVLIVFNMVNRPEWIFKRVSRLEFSIVFAVSLGIGLAHKPRGFEAGFIPKFFQIVTDFLS
jgi:hypothetical protein